MAQTRAYKPTKAVGGTRKVKFVLAAKPGCKVYVAGSFNDWNPARHRLRYSKSTGKYRLSIELGPGTHEYKFRIDDEWLIDPECDNWVSNQFDTLNSVLTVE